VATISSLLADHVSLRVRSVDRILLAGYVPRLQSDGLLVRFLNARAGGTIPSPAILGKIGDAYVEQIDAFAKAREIPVVRFVKQMVKEDVARPHMQAAEREGRCGVVMLGVAQEKAFAWRGWRDGGRDEHPHFEFGRQAVFINHHYFYIFDPDWGPSFIKTNAYAPYPVWAYLNGHEWAKRQAINAGIEFAPWITAFVPVIRPSGTPGFATRCLSNTSSVSVTGGWASSRRRSPRLSGAATAIATPSGRSRCQILACSISPRRAVRGLSRRSAISSTSAALTRSRSSLTVRSPAAPPAGFRRR